MSLCDQDPRACRRTRISVLAGSLSLKQIGCGMVQTAATLTPWSLARPGVPVQSRRPKPEMRLRVDQGLVAVRCTSYSCTAGTNKRVSWTLCVGGGGVSVKISS